MRYFRVRSLDNRFCRARHTQISTRMWQWHGVEVAPINTHARTYSTRRMLVMTSRHLTKSSSTPHICKNCFAATDCCRIFLSVVVTFFHSYLLLFSHFRSIRSTKIADYFFHPRWSRMCVCMLGEPPFSLLANKCMWHIACEKWCYSLDGWRDSAFHSQIGWHTKRNHWARNVCMHWQ